MANPKQSSGNPFDDLIQLDAARENGKVTAADIAVPGWAGLRRVIPIAKDYVQNVYQRGREAGQEAYEAGRNIGEGGPVLANVGKVVSANTRLGMEAIPLVGHTGNTVADDVAGGNYAGAAGGSAGIATAILGPEVVGKGTGALKAGARSAKASLLVSEELKAAAAQPIREAAEINAQAASQLQKNVGPSLDKIAHQAGVDTSGVPSLSEKANAAGRALRSQARDIYSKADQAYEQVTGHPGRFQDLNEAIREYRQQLYDGPNPELQQRLQAAEQQLGDFTKQAKDAGIDVTAANALWSQGSALGEVSRGFLQAEDVNGNLKGNGPRPLDTQVKRLSAPASPRGHILQQALGDEAATVQQHVTNASESIQGARAASKAAKNATQQVNSIRANQRRVAKAVGYSGAAGAIIGGAKSALSGK